MWELLTTHFYLLRKTNMPCFCSASFQFLVLTPARRNEAYLLFECCNVYSDISRNYASVKSDDQFSTEHSSHQQRLYVTCHLRASHPCHFYTIALWKIFHSQLEGTVAIHFPHTLKSVQSCISCRRQSGSQIRISLWAMLFALFCAKKGPADNAIYHACVLNGIISTPQRLTDTVLVFVGK